jgi:formamidopyrimidine-DNA glycosylase
MLEVEYYRRMATGCLGRRISDVEVPDPHCLGGQGSESGVRLALVGRSFDLARRRGKMLLLDTVGTPADGDSTSPGVSGPTLGLRFGMTGRLVLDGRAAIDQLLYSPSVIEEKWVRFSVGFADGGRLSLHDPRRLGRVELDPAEDALGPDAFDLSLGALRSALAPRPPSEGPALKARLQDQAKLAGVGNLLADEILWRAGLSPLRPSGSLSDAELRRLHRHLRGTLRELFERGGSHTGDLMDQRGPGGRCPRDGATLRRNTVGGRTTWWCPEHQR